MQRGLFRSFLLGTYTIIAYELNDDISFPLVHALIDGDGMCGVHMRLSCTIAVLLLSTVPIIEQAYGTLY